MSSELGSAGPARDPLFDTSDDALLDLGLAAEHRVRSPRPLPSTPRRRWEAAYTRAVVVCDVLAIGLAVALGDFLGLGSHSPVFGDLSPILGLIVFAFTLFCLFVTRAWDSRVLGQGSEELSRLMRAFVSSAVVIGLVGLVLEVQAVRPWTFGLIPLAGAMAGLGRYALRKRLHRRRDDGACMHPMLTIGTVEAVRDMITRSRRDRHNGWEVVGACTPTGRGEAGAPDILGVPVVSDLDAVSRVVATGPYRVVSIGSMPGWTSRRLHQLAWDLEEAGADLVVDPGLMEVAGPRLHVSPVDGMPVLRLTRPAFTGVPRVVKSLVDIVGASLLVLVLLPVLALIALAVRLEGGPAFFRQSRVGKHGREFKMIKFRTMVVDADKRRAELLGQNDGAGPLFKMRDDPRITRVGSVLRKYSLDELPQLFNVLFGTMSLVGPRPPLPEEVATYERDAQRKLLVRPGLTGLWQVSGRSDLSWEESVRLDLRYVENWTLALDTLILWKTLGAIVKSRGAY